MSPAMSLSCTYLPALRSQSKRRTTVPSLFARFLLLLVASLSLLLPMPLWGLEKIALKQEASVEGALTYQFVGAMTRSDPQPLPAPDKKGWVELTVPPTYRHGNSLLKIVYEKWRRVVQVPLDGDGVHLMALRDPAALVGNDDLDKKGQEAQAAQWLKWIRTHVYLPDGSPRGPFAPLGPSLLLNGQFQSQNADGTPTHWRLIVHPPAQAIMRQLSTLTPPLNGSGEVLRVHLIQQGAQAQDAQLIQDNLLTMQEGKPYTLSFWAKADRNLTCKVAVLVSHPTQNTSVGLQKTFAVTPEWQHYSYAFLAKGTYSKQKLSLLLGGARGMVDVANVTLRPGVEKAFVERGGPVIGMRLTENSFPFAEVTQIPIRYQGKAAAGVKVTLHYEGGGDEVTLGETEQGIARFRNVPLHTLLTFTVHRGEQQLLVSKTLEGKDFDAAQSVYTTAPVEVPGTWTGVQTVAEPEPPPPAVAKTAPPVPAVPVPVPDEKEAPTVLIGGICALSVILGGLFWVLDARRRRNAFNTSLERLYPPLGGGTLSHHSPDQPAVEIPLPTPPLADLPAPAPLTKPQPRLIGLQGPYKGYTFPIQTDGMRVGRDTVNEVVLTQDASTSRRHAILHITEGECTITDENSSNGVFVNGTRLEAHKPHPMNPNDEIEIGKTLFRFEV